MSVDSAVDLTKDRLSQGILDWDVSKSDLDDISEAVGQLSPSERNEFIGKLSDDDIKNWTQEIDGLMGSLSAGERADLFNQLAEGMDGTQAARFIGAFDGSAGGRQALAEAIASHGTSEAKLGLVDSLKDRIDGQYSATAGTWGNAETVAIGEVLASLADDPNAFQAAVAALSPQQLQDVMSVAMGRRHIVDFSGQTPGFNTYDTGALTGILNAAQGTDLKTREAVFAAAMPQLEAMQGDTGGRMGGAGASIDAVADAMGNVLNAEEAQNAGLVDVPEAPKGVDMEANVQEAHDHSGWTPGNAQWFYDQIKAGGEWDYKTAGAQYEDFGNFHFGLAAAAMGIPENIALRGAGYYQENVTENSQDDWGSWHDLNGGPYGDDPNDQANIRAGYDFYESGLWRVWN
ncbi:hypothetical protein LDO32_12845 [Luteimonas sp. Y-2-2-4F]|nr:polymorphic toxin type 44 domain-containing protein [Luteimonas sp. Y-2-2-4F]MCD9032614.1 hypothetical protein [Luteimonas sp. Y-2-2-4F]